MCNKKKICLIMMLALSMTAIPTEVFAQDKESVNVSEEEELKASKETLDRAKSSMANKDYQSAIVYLTAYINAKPKKYEPYKLRGECFYALRQYKLAESDFQTAIDLKTADDKFITGTKVVGAVILGADKNDQHQNPELGNLYGQLMYSQKAQNTQAYEASYQKAFEYNSHIYLPQPKKDEIAKINCPQKYGKVLNPQGADAYIFGVIDDIEKGDFHEAAYKLPNITSTYPKYYLGYYLTGVVMAGLEQDNDAINSFETALKYNPYDFESMASLGQIYYSEAEKTFKAEDAEKSIEYFNKALKYNPDCHIYYYYIGLNNMILGKNDLAISNFNSAIKLKANDYNSIYYKLIAQYLVGDYNSVIDGTTKLLYRHVSNYNSVLYLRALAYRKLGNIEASMSDIEKIFTGMDDIYNADIKTLSPKEQTLESYLYYLKAQILRENGEGAKVDFEKAYKNPIIEAFGNSKDYNTKLIISANDIENQYDYIRTAFDNSNVLITYKNPDYELSISRDKSESITQTNPQVLLRPETNPEDTLSKDDQTSIAQLLATQAIPQQTKVPEIRLGNVEEKSEEVPSNSEPEVKNMPSENAEIVKKAVQQEPVKEAPIEDKIQESSTKADENLNTTENKVDEVQPKTDLAEEKIEASPVKIISEQPKQTEQPKQVVEKYAEFDIKEFNVPQKNVSLEVKTDDEIVVFVPTNKIAEAEEKIKNEEYNIKNPNLITDNFAQIRQNADSERSNIEKSVDNIVQTQQDILPQKEPEIVVKEVIVDKQIEEKIAQVQAEAVSQSEVKAEETSTSKNVSESNEVQKSDSVSDIKDNVMEPVEVHTVSKDEISENIVKSDDKILAKEKIKKDKKAKKLAKQEEKIANIVQSVLSDNAENPVLENSEKEKKVKEKKVKVKTKKVKDEKEILLNNNNEIGESDTKEIKNPEEKASEEPASETGEEVIKPEKKHFKWWWQKKEKTTTTDSDKKEVSLKKILSKESGDNSEVYEQTKDSKKIIKKQEN